MGEQDVHASKEPAEADVAHLFPDVPYAQAEQAALGSVQQDVIRAQVSNSHGREEGRV